MTSTLTAATLTVKIHESISLNGKDQGATTSLSLSSINEISKRIVTVTTTEATILTFSSAIGQGTYVAANVKYIRFTNLDDTNHIMLTFKDEDNTEFRVKVDKGQSFIYNGDISGGVVDTMKANGSALASGLADLYDVTADADTASCDMEIFIASA
jgi:hypothetical protein|tara:strand:- start:117 stop:584 length:468 start_codon:yes stop_codon:yes gene_type:complete